MALDILRDRVGGILIAAISGRLDNESAPDFELFAQESVAGGERHIVLDLSELGYISNAGVRTLASLSKSLNTPSTSLRLAGVQPTVRQILDAAGVAVLLTMFPSRAAALDNHPASGGENYAKLMMELLKIEPVAEQAATPAEVKLAELAFDLLAGKQHAPRAARAIAQGTQVMRRVSAGDIAAGSAAGKAAKPAPAPVKKRSFWQRLFGRK
ncbi:STAS domain-containing protein [Pseudomarimonas arenosa]|uniref:Anti-sigma factor antagonist n=1 Tax=Pseudomarimonas arenosa TaxID=2774145 RepID=A0AAW3ZJI1_9GAMM|nr:STAS domain-containing protein [Pseudomarimonas arenosa]MBD8525182.1 STAS domain-containing protein [Pseudomarimonas arenosa]